LDIGEGDEVIVPCQTFIATGSVVALRGARAVFSEVDENFSISLEDVKRKVNERTKAVIVVHFAGLIQENIWELKRFLDERGIYLIEDCAHAHGARIGDRLAGSIGISGCFSFYSTKIITTGEGGMITTNEEWLYKLVKSIRNRGRDVDKTYEIYANLGRNSRMTEIQGILGRYQLRRLDEFTAHRNRLAQTYKSVLRGCEGIERFQDASPDVYHSYWRFVVFLKDGVDRKAVISKMAEKKISVDTPYTPLLHLQPVFKRMYSIEEGMLPYSEALSKRHICLPMHLGISVEDAQYIGEALVGVLKEIELGKI